MHSLHTVVDMLTSQTFWIALQALGTIAAFIAILRQVRKAQSQIKVMQDQTDAMRATTRWDLLLRMESRFDSEPMRVARGRAALALKLATTSQRPLDFWKVGRRGRHVQNVLDMFETLGLLVKQHAIGRCPGPC